jgi:hypothetical protein
MNGNAMSGNAMNKIIKELIGVGEKSLIDT